MNTPTEVLARYWGYSTFRPPQDLIIQSVLEGKDTLALLPTGGGKSLCYQVPALCLPGLAIVVSPLIALMQDQVSQLKKKGIPALAISSAMNSSEIDIALDNCIHGKVKLLYVSPERLKSELFQERVRKMDISLVAIDEAHCISQWGYDFRPPYLEIPLIKEILAKPVPFLALTATATPVVKDDIAAKLELNNFKLFQKSFKRENLSYSVLYEENKLGKLVDVIKRVNACGIVYVRSRRKTVEIATLLSKQGISAEYYHAGLDTKERNLRQKRWMENKSKIIVATNAFGMGIDKPDVRVVLHIDIPDCIENYFQEAGRGGRDGEKAYSVLICNQADLNKIKEKEAYFPDIAALKKVYDCLFNYLQVPVEAGANITRTFDIKEFCVAYDLKALEALEALKILQQEGIIALNDAFYEPSKVFITTNYDNLYNFQVRYQKYEPLLKAVLRSYEGVFTMYRSISEDDLAKRTELPVKEVQDQLKKLQKMNILEYVPQQDKPSVSILQARVSAKDLRINTDRISFLQKQERERTKAIRDFVNNKTECRSIGLLRYFGEESSDKCGKCDVCTGRNDSTMSDTEFLKLQELIKSAVMKQGLNIDQLQRMVPPAKRAKALEVSRHLLDIGSLKIAKDGILKWQLEN